MMARGGFCADSELSEIISELWDMDDNKLHHGKHYELDLQGYVCSTRDTSKDFARDSLFAYVNDDVFERPTYKAFVALLDNYAMEVGEEEVVTKEERQEIHEFLDAIMETEVMKAAHRFLVKKKKAESDERVFKYMLQDIWFRLFSRSGGRKDSCSFEHVFVGEGRGEEMIGLHNWIQFYLQEKCGNIDYHGYFRRDTKRDDEEIRLLAVQFDWQGQKAKPLCSVFIGSSPEFEIAAYTICLLLDRDGKLDVQMGEYECEFTVHSHHRKLGTAYIAAARMEEHGKQYHKKKW